MSYGIWLSYNNQQEVFQIPVNPGSIEMGDGINSSTYNVVGLGEINVIKDPKLTEYSFSGIFPSVQQEYITAKAEKDKKYLYEKNPFVTATELLGSITVDGVKTNGYVYYITKWMATKRPIRFVFTGDSFDINVGASIESFDWKEVAGSGGDIEYTLKLKKYVFYAAKRVIYTTDTKAGIANKIVKQERHNDKQPPKTHTLIAGETLWKVAKNVLGNENLWPQIQKLNSIPNGKLKSLKVGMLLKLPEVKGNA